MSTSRAAGDSESLARSLQRSRELVVEPSELQRLPVTAMIVSYGAGAERRVLLADANPAIGALPVATLAPLAEAAVRPPRSTACRAPTARPPGPCRTPPGGPRPTSDRPARLDWRAARNRAELTVPSRPAGPTARRRMPVSG